jgi:phage shock protein A
MSEADLRLLVEPEKDPRVVDLRSAGTYVVGNLKKDASSRGATSNPSKPRGDGEPIIAPPDCQGLARKLNGYIAQRSRFHKTILQAQGQLDDWEATNHKALVNAAKDGIEYFTGNLLESLANRGKAAERLQMIYTRNASKMAEEGVDILALEAKIRRLNTISSAGHVAEVTSSINDWQSFIKDGMSSLIMQLNGSNDEVKQILEDPKLQKYFESESPELKTLLDISKLAAAHKVFGKWVARRLPIIGGVEIGIKQLYNGTEWATSFYMMAEANNINGKVMDSARSLQKRIDDTRIELQACP